MFEFSFPDIGEGTTEGEIVRWLVRVGDVIKAHQPLVEMETDKALVEIPSPAAGTVKELRGSPGDTVAVGGILAVIDESGPAPVENRSKSMPGPGVVGRLEEAGQPPVREQAAAAVLPRDRKLAAELAVDLGRLLGTGPGGRITAQDIRSAARVRPEPGNRIPLRGVRKAMARAMTTEAHAAVAATIMDQADALDLRAVRKRERSRAAEQGVDLTYLPFIVMAVVQALKAFPLLNSSLAEDGSQIVLHPEIHMGFAVDTPDGLLVPMVRDAGRMELLELALALENLFRQARERQLKPEDLKGSTFTITNYGALGGLWGTPALNPPEAGVLGVGRIEETPVVRDGQVVARPTVPLSLTFDHRIIDGATALRFLNRVIKLIEDPEPLLGGPGEG